jgi:ribosome-associated protein
MHDNEDDQNSLDERPSKSRLKRDSESLQELGSRLIELPEAQLKQIPMPAELEEAIMLARRIRQHGGRKRQLKYVGRLLRGLDAEPIEGALARLEMSAAESTAHHHRLEAWRERMITEGDGAVGEFIDSHPAVDRQQLRQLVRNAQKERQREQPPRYARELFRLLRDAARE